MELTMEIPTAGPETYCRLCLGKDSLLGVFSLAQNGSNSSTELVEKIFQCTNIKLSSTVDAGCAICHRCLQAVQDFYHFRVRSNKVNDLIQVTTVVANGDDSSSTDGARYSPTPSKQPKSATPAATNNKPSPTAGGQRKYHCRYCPKSFRTVAGLTEHGNKAHLANRQHHCPNCLAQFQHAPSLARHVRSRSCFAFSKYRCRVCSESFHERKQWADHIQIHAKDFPYQCPDCWSQFKHKATLRRHANTVHLLVKV
ncbi:zinc finger protein 135-like [Anopheles maculipalpis]|uniref:zinc finger protein 135-like n=1 Tax=Anopheles maculipalpis TaxID=1496333 RepID=UPI0021596D9B|nr:zinc finger protein 135-like [Anopheles maculipalpis]